VKYSDFPQTINGFTKGSSTSKDSNANWNYVGYTRGNDLGYVTAADLQAGLKQVRKIDQVRPEGGGRKLAIPSPDRIW